MAEKKQHTLTAASESSPKPQQSKPGQQTNMKPAAPVGNPVPLRIGAVGLWLVALACEILAILIGFGKINVAAHPQWWHIVIPLVVDLACVIIGAQLWKKANHIAPASEKNKTLFWLWNNMGLIAAIVCFVPVIILTLTNKNLDKKTKTIATVVAVVALLIGGLAGIDWNPVSQEQLAAAENALGSQTVYWSRYGKVYHTDEYCSALNRSDEVTYGTVEEAVAANRVRLCKFCAKRDNITDVATDAAEGEEVPVTETVSPEEEEDAA